MTSSQFGFKDGHSTTLALSEFVEFTMFLFDKGKVVYAVLLNLSKAFNCVDRGNMLDKIKYYKRDNVWIFRIIPNWKEIFC